MCRIGVCVPATVYHCISTPIFFPTSSYQKDFFYYVVITSAANILKIILAIWSLSWFHMNFGIDFSISEKKKCHWALMGIAINMDSFG